ncbi:MAG: winged helix DNA-binding domain-containing protein [Thermaerobacter sp.]|nr:winged helix DNA-binding domain-containing protein [Thermaerobacter sp.]
MDRSELLARLVAWVGLTGLRRESVADTVRRLGAVQLDPVQVVVPAHLWTLSLRRGPTPPEALNRALATGDLLEGYCHARALVHREDAAALVQAFRHHRARELGRQYGVAGEMRSALAVMERQGPVLSRTLASTRRVVAGWDARGAARTKATSAALELLWWEGRIAVVSRAGGQKQYDLLSRHLPQVDHQIETLPEGDAARAAVRHQYRTMGIVGPGGSGPPWSGSGGPARSTWTAALADEGELVPVSADGKAYWVWGALLDGDPPTPRRGWLLAPLDNLLWHRPRLEALAGFHYRWEIYTPAAKRRVGPYNMPVLQGTRFWGEADARWEEGRLTTRLVAGGADPTAGILRAVAAAEALCARLRGIPGADSIPEGAPAPGPVGSGRPG